LEKGETIEKSPFFTFSMDVFLLALYNINIK